MILYIFISIIIFTMIFLFIGVIRRLIKLQHENKQLLSLFTAEYNKDEWEIFEARHSYFAKNKNNLQVYPCKKHGNIYTVIINSEQILKIDKDKK